MPDADDFVTEAERKRLILAFVNGRRGKVVSESEARQLCNWAVRVRVDEAALALILKGEADVADIEGNNLTLVKPKSNGRSRARTKTRAK